MDQGPPGVFGKRRVPCVRAGLLSRCLETPAWIRAQGSHHALPRSGGEPASTALEGGRSSLSIAVSHKSIEHCTYVDRTRSFRRSEQFFVCHGGQQKGKAVSKQRLAHWIVEAVALAYQSQGEPCPLGVRAHSTRSVASSHALAHGTSLADICRAAAGRHRTPSQDSTVSALSQFLPVCWVTANGREELAVCCAIPPHPGIRAPFFSSSSVPRMVNPGGILQAPPAVRLGRAV